MPSVSSGTTFLGPNGGGNTGVSVWQADVNGDNVTDFIIGVPGLNRVYVVYGREGGLPPTFDLATMTSIDGYVLTLQNPVLEGAKFGASLAVTYTGDGEPVLAVGAPDVFDRGRVYFLDLSAIDVAGRPFELDVDFLPARMELHFDGDSGEHLGQYLGATSIAEDLLEAVSGQPSGAIQAGGNFKTYVFSFADNSKFKESTGLPPTPTITLTSSEADSQLGQGNDIGSAPPPESEPQEILEIPYGSKIEIGGAGGTSDFDGNGFGDIAVTDAAMDTANGVDSGGGVLIYGTPTPLPESIDITTVDGSDGFIIRGPAAGSFSFDGSAIVGDITGDGKAELVLTDSHANGDKGAVTIIFGTDTDFGADGFDPALLDGSNGVRITGSIAGDRFGFRVCGLGDIDGDGFRDLSVSAYGANSAAGAVYVIKGADGGVPSGNMTIDQLIALGRAVRYDGVAAGDQAAYLDPGDFNRDGFADMGVGAPDADGGDGAAYMVYGGKPTTAVTRNGSGVGQTIRGGDLVDTLNGLGGNDLLMGYLGADTLDGGSGLDVADYRDRTNTVAVTLNGATNATVTVGGGAEDTVRNIEGVAGGSGTDTLTGDGLDNYFRGGGGKDTIDGAAGADTVDFGDKTQVVNVTLNNAADAFVTVGGVSDDTVRHVENVIGGSQADTLNGDGFDNALAGRDGNDTLFGGTGIDQLFGDDGNDRLDSGDGADTMDGGGGTDTAQFFSAGGSVVLTLNGAADVVATIGGVAQDTLRRFENVAGGFDTDTLTGDGADNQIQGYFGSDTLNGGAGSDTAYYGDHTSAVVVTLNGATNVIVTNGGANEDTIRNFENVIGGTAADTLTGDGLANMFSGGSGNDTLFGAGGADVLDGGNNNDSLAGGNDSDRFLDSSGTDTMDGGAGSDTASYATSVGFSAISVTLNGATNVTVSVNGVAQDTIRNIENVFGSGGNDTLTGDGLANDLRGYTPGGSLSFDGENVLSGMGGDDVLGGGSGADTLDGGSGNDTADFSRTTAFAGGVTVSLAVAGAQNTGSAGFDTLIGIESLSGSAFADTLTGDGADNRLDGGEADDTLTGGNGADTLAGGTGTDSMTGGIGNDVYAVDEAFDIVVEALGQGFDAIDTTLNSFTLGANLERVNFAGTGNFIGTGNSLANRFTGGGGDDRFVDIAGGDTFSGGIGADIVDLRAAATGAVINLATGIHGGATAGDVYASIEKFFGSNAAGDSMTGNTGKNGFYGFGGNDTLAGGAHNDRLEGGNGADSLDGGAELDILNGGAGNDTHTGGAAVDYFEYSAVAFGQDTVTDFADGQDRLKFFSAVANELSDFTIAGNGTTSVLITLISAPANTITLTGAAAITITAADFLFY